MSLPEKVINFFLQGKFDVTKITSKEGLLSLKKKKKKSNFQAAPLAQEDPSKIRKELLNAEEKIIQVIKWKDGCD